MTRKSIQSLCVYCGSSIGRMPAYAEHARALGRAFAQRGICLVYGGASVGIMGVVADAALAAGGEVIGVIPAALADKEIAHHGLTKLHVTQSMHERKALMADLSDGYIALPGGIGTLEEIFEILTWAQLGFHEKPCALLNVDGYYDALTTFLDHTVAEAFVQPLHRSMLMVEHDADVLLDRFANYVAPTVKKCQTERTPAFLLPQKSEQQRCHLAPIATDEVFVVECRERGEQAFFRDAVGEIALRT
jgi:uncharacterized protein (TIGR00730 family)